MPTTRSGEVITWKEFMHRWKKGIENLTPIQKTKNDIVSTLVILVGFIVCTFALLFFNNTFGALTYGLILIFMGNIYSNVVKLFGLTGQLKTFKDIDNQINSGEKEVI